jgi:large subunit ribosomal protein L4
MEKKIFLENLERKKKSIGLIHKVYLAQLKNSRKYTAFTKTKSEVRGGGKKPWRQKGTGNARAGSSRSPLWVGGGVSFGPKPRIVYKKINKKERRLAILSALYLKKQQFLFIDEQNLSDFNEIKTKNIIAFLSTLGINENQKILIVLSKPNKKIWLASRNLKNIKITTVNSLNLDLILKTNHILLSNTSLESINSNYGKSYT